MQLFKKAAIIAILLIAVLIAVLIAAVSLLTARPDKKQETNLTKYKASIVLTRESAWGGAFLDYSVFLDDEEIGSISSGDTKKYTLDLTEGNHILYIKKWFTKSKKLEFNVDNKSTSFRYTCKTSDFWGINLFNDATVPVR